MTVPHLKSSANVTPLSFGYYTEFSGNLTKPDEAWHSKKPGSWGLTPAYCDV